MCRPHLSPRVDDQSTGLKLRTIGSASCLRNPAQYVEGLARNFCMLALLLDHLLASTWQLFTESLTVDASPFQDFKSDAHADVLVELVSCRLV
jgi:hypothetical protein